MSHRSKILGHGGGASIIPMPNMCRPFLVIMQYITPTSGITLCLIEHHKSSRTIESIQKDMGRLSVNAMPFYVT